MKRSVIILGKIILLIVILYTVCIPKVYAEDYWGDIIELGDDFLNVGKQSSPESDKSTIQDVVNFIYNTLLVLGIIAAVIVGAILGIQYMTSSVEEQAKIKETLTAYVIGCLVIFSAFGIWKVVVTVLKQV